MVAVRYKGVRCGSCKFNQIRKDGNEDYFGQNCNAAVCKLYAFGTLENVELWEWYDQILAWQESGLAGPVNDCMTLFDVTMLAAFTLFRRVVNEDLVKAKGGA